MSVPDEPPAGPVQSSDDLTGSWPSDENLSQSTFLNGDNISPEAGEKNQKPNTAATLDCSDLVAKIQAGDPAGMEQLYATFSRGMRYYLNRQLGPDVEDNVHDIFLIVIKAIQNGTLREPERLMGFVRTVARRAVAQRIDTLVKNRNRERDFDFTATVADFHDDPERTALIKERAAVVKEALGQLSSRDREILERFYLREQTPEVICSEMNLTETQFRLCKSRAKTKFGEIGRKRFSLRGFPRSQSARM